MMSGNLVRFPNLRKKYVLDTWPVMEWLKDRTPVADILDDLIARADKKEIELSMSMINGGEVYYNSAREWGLARAEEILAQLRKLPIELVSARDEDVIAAARLKVVSGISYADGFAACLAIRLACPLLTGDSRLPAVGIGKTTAVRMAGRVSQGEWMEGERTRPWAQKTIGILGGMSNQATGEYYRLLNEGLNARLGGWDNGEIVIVSVNFGNIEWFIRNDRWDLASAYISEKLNRLEAAGTNVIVCVSNTMHRTVVPLMESRTTPFLHIADPTGSAIRAAGLTRVALLGTLPTMESPELAARYRDRFGVEVMAPVHEEAVEVDRVIFDELVRRELKAEAKAKYLEAIAGLRAAGAQGVILGCTEIFLLIGQDDLPGFPVFDTTSLHVNAIVEFVLAGAAA